jgi:hypothetical protein
MRCTWNGSARPALQVNLIVCSVRWEMPDRPVHMVRATLCGRGRRADAFTGDWKSVTCLDCEQRRIGPRSACLHCHRVITGSCAHIHRFDAWLHADCIPAFELSPLGRHLRQCFPDLFYPPKCSRCGTPGDDHDQNCR